MVMLFGGIAGTVSASPQFPDKPRCKPHGYHRGRCKPGGGIVTVGVPGLSPSAIVVVYQNPGAAVDVQIAAAASPVGAPAGSSCFTASVFSRATGQPLSNPLPAPLVFRTGGSVFAYNSSTGQFTLLGRGSSGFAASNFTGLFCVSFGIGGQVGLPSTGGNA